MKPWMTAGSTALALLCATGAVQADVTPEEVWTNWKSMSEGYGQAITAASEARDGDTLVVTGLTMTVDQDGAKVSGTIDELRLTDQGDGTVEIVSSDTYSMTMETPAMEGEGAAKMAILVSLPGMVTIASGTPEAVSYAVTAPSIAAHVEGADATDPAKGAVVIDMVLTETTATYNVAAAEAGQNIDYQFASKSTAVSASANDSESGTDMTLNLAIADVAGTSSGLMLGAEAMADLTAALKAGFTFATDMTYGAGTFEVNVVENGAPSKVAGTIGSGSLGLGMDQAAFRLQTGSKNVALTIESADIPLPDLSLSYGETAFNMLVPLAKSETPSEFAMGISLIDLSVSDALWGMIDPGAALPHDPATLVIDTKGTATLTSDLTDEEAMMAMEGVPPGMLNSFDLSALQLKIAGAELTGAGAFTFDNADMESFGGMPAPTGKLDLKAVGLNGLIDKLVSMGLLPEDQAMQGKMMMGMFAQPGDGEDTLVSTIEFADKAMTINGMEMPMQ